MNIHKIKKLKPLLLPLLSLSLLVGILFWFNNKYSSNKIDILSIISPEKSATYLIESEENVNLDRPFTTTIVMDTKGHAVNTIGVQLLYQHDSLEVLNIDTRDSFCQFYPEKKINDTLGLISLSCGSPHPGFTGENDVIKIEFQPLKIGITTLTIKNTSQILLSDGKGTNILREYPQKKINILNSL